MNIAELISEHEIQLEWFPCILWISSKKYSIDPIGVKRVGISNKQAMDDGISQLIEVIDVIK